MYSTTSESNEELAKKSILGVVQDLRTNLSVGAPNCQINGDQRNASIKLPPDDLASAVLVVPT